MGNNNHLCRLCRIKGGKTNRHHLVPKQFGGKIKERMHTRCHKFIHGLISNEVLAKEYNTIEKLKTHPVIIAYLKWRREFKAKDKVSQMEEEGWTTERKWGN